MKDLRAENVELRKRATHAERNKWSHSTGKKLNLGEDLITNPTSATRAADTPTTATATTTTIHGP